MRKALHNTSILCIGGFDPSGLAGISADARMIEHLGGHASCLVSLDTVQNRIDCRLKREPDLRWLQQQWDALWQDARKPYAAIKIGALGGLEQTRWLADQLASLNLPIVLDPVLGSSSGAALGRPSALQPLLSLASVVTPNQAELCALYGLARAEDWRPEPEAGATLVTGTDAAQQGGQPRIQHRLYFQGQTWDYFYPLLPGRYRGTGCLLASAIACALAAGQTIPQACRFGLDEVMAWLVPAHKHPDAIHCPRPPE